MAATANGTNLQTQNENANRSKTVGTVSNIDPYGFERGNEFDYKSYEEFQSDYLAVVTRRTIRWNDFMKQGTKSKVKRNGRAKRFCRKGIPERYRSQAWMDISGATKKMKENPDLFEKLLSQPHQDDSFDKELIDSINTDLDRTFPDNIYFKDCVDNHENKQTDLSDVLKACGRHIPSVGYCQGMNYVAALLLLVVKDKEKCFWLLCALVNDILPAYYSKEMVGLRTEMHVLTDLVRQKYPVLQQKMDDCRVSWTLVASKWFVCLFVDVIPIETVLRIWDCLFFEGSKILFRVALGVIQDRQLVLANCQGMPDIIKAFKRIQSDMNVLECHTFMKKCFTETNPLRRAEIEKLRRKSQKLVEKEDEEYEKRKRDRNP